MLKKISLFLALNVLEHLRSSSGHAKCVSSLFSFCITLLEITWPQAQLAVVSSSIFAFCRRLLRLSLNFSVVLLTPARS